MGYILYTDGACSGNPGPGGFGTIIFDGSVIHEIGEHFSTTTNNRMELQAVISGFNFILQKKDFQVDKKIQVYTDSVYVIKGITKWIFGWQKKSWLNSEGVSVVNKDLWQILYHLVYNDFCDYKVNWDYVRGHNNDPGNERCDEIAVSFSKQNYIQLIHSPVQNYLFDITKPPVIEVIPENKSFQIKDSSKKTWYISLINGVVTRYDSWKDCEAQVKGRSGVKFKKISSDLEEQNILKLWGR